MGVVLLGTAGGGAPGAAVGAPGAAPPAGSSFLKNSSRLLCNCNVNNSVIILYIRNFHVASLNNISLVYMQYLQNYLHQFILTMYVLFKYFDELKAFLTCNSAKTILYS